MHTPSPVESPHDQPCVDSTDGERETAQDDEPMVGSGRRGRKLFREMNAATERQHTTPLRTALSALYLAAAMAAYPDNLQLHYPGLMQIVREVQGVSVHVVGPDTHLCPHGELDLCNG